MSTSGCQCEVSVGPLYAMSFHARTLSLFILHTLGAADLPDDLESIDAEIRNMVCDDCWHAFFSFSAFQAAWRVGLERTSLIRFRGCNYQRSLDAMGESAANGCRWCFVVGETIKDKVSACTAFPPVRWVN